MHQKNGGVSKARNAGLELANGDYYNFPDSDDYLDKDTYEYLLGLIETHDCDAANYEYYVTLSDNETAHLLDESKYGLKNTEEAHKIIMSGEPFACNKLFKKQLITDNDLPGIKFNEEIFRGEDSLFAHSAIDRAKTIWFDKRPLYHYVQSEQSACRGHFRRNQLSGLRLYEEYRRMFQRKYPDLWQEYLKNALHLPIHLYYAMYADEEDFQKEMLELKNVYKKRYKEVTDSVKLSGKLRIKFSLFYYSPTVFCKVHKWVHRL